MKKKGIVITVSLVFVTAFLLGAITYINTVLSSANSPTQIHKTKAAAITYTRKIDLFSPDETGGSITPTVSPNAASSVSVATPPPKSPLVSPTIVRLPTGVPTKIPTQIVSSAPTIIPTVLPTQSPTIMPTVAQSALLSQSTLTPTNGVKQTTLIATPTLSPLLAYKSISTPTLIPTANKGATIKPTEASSIPTKKLIQPTGVQQLPETGWIQTSSILFIVAASTILFSLLF